MQRGDFAAKDGIGSLGPNPVRGPLSVSREDKRPRKEKNREIRLENAAFCETQQVDFKAEDKGFEPSTGYPAPDFESGS